jgi:hypothetical protein
MNLVKLTLPIALLAIGSGCGLVDLFDGSNDDDYYVDYAYDSGGSYNDFGGGSAEQYQSARWNYRSTTWASVNGVGIRNSRTAWAGMSSLTCELSMATGATQTDLDLDWSTDERLVGVDGGAVISTTGENIITMDPDTTANTQTPTGTIIDILPSGGTVTTIERDDGDCKVRVYGAPGGRGGRERLHDLIVDGTLCLGGKLTTDGGRVWVGTSTSITEVVPTAPTSSTSSVIATIGADILVFDVDAQVLYAAARLGTMLYGLELDGSVRWTAELPLPIRDIKLVPGDLSALVAIGDTREGGEVVRISGTDGTWMSEITTQVVPQRLAIGPDGRNIAVQTATDVTFFDTAR